MYHDRVRSSISIDLGAHKRIASRIDVFSSASSFFRTAHCEAFDSRGNHHLLMCGDGLERPYDVGKLIYIRLDSEFAFFPGS